MSRYKSLPGGLRLPPPQARRQRLRFGFKAAITVTILAFLFSRVDAARFWSVLRDARPGWAAAALVVCSSAFITSSCKWHGLLAALEITVPRWPLIKMYAIGHFASSFLPGTVGGDLLRCRMIGPASRGYLKAAASILVERISGVIAMVVLAATAVAVDSSRLATAPVLTLVASGAALLVAGLLVALNRPLATTLMYRLRRHRLRKVVSVLYDLHRTLRTFPRLPLIAALGWSVLFYLGSGALLFCSVRALGESISLIESVSVFTVVCLLMLVPISVGGLGLRQAGDVYMLGLIGIEPASALAISLFRQAINYVYTLIGGLFFVTWRELETAELPPRTGPVVLAGQLKPGGDQD